MEKIRLNLGAGYRHYGNFINIDKYVTTQMIEDRMIKGDITVFTHPYAEYLQADMLALPFVDNSVDYIECADTIDHFSFRKIGKIVSEMHRVLKPGAMCRVQVPNFDSLAKLWTGLFDRSTDDNALKTSSEWMLGYFLMSTAIYGEQLHEADYKKSIWCPTYASFMFMQEIKFTSINIMTFPPDQIHKSPLEVVHAPAQRTIHTEQMVIEAVK